MCWIPALPTQTTELFVFLVRQAPFQNGMTIRGLHSRQPFQWTQVQWAVVSRAGLGLPESRRSGKSDYCNASDKIPTRPGNRECDRKTGIFYRQFPNWPATPSSFRRRSVNPLSKKTPGLATPSPGVFSGGPHSAPGPGVFWRVDDEFSVRFAKPQICKTADLQNR